VTAILPNESNIFMDRLAGGAFVLNGAGEVSGLTQVVEWGLIETPILLTNTMSVGAVSDAVARYMVEKHPGIGEEHDVIIPVVGECDDSWLNDISGNHVREEHVRQAIDDAKSGPVAEGGVGGGTGMITCDFKGGIGTSSRKLPEVFGGYTLGVLVMSNFGKMHNLRVAGMPVGEVLAEKFRKTARREHSYGSIIAVVATDAPLLPHQLNRLCKRVALGIGRVGSYAAHGSGEIVVGFSTANVIPRRTRKMVYKMKILLDQRLDPLYEAVMEATEEAILNAMCMAQPMTGVNGNHVPALPLEDVRAFVDATRPIFASVKKTPQEPARPAAKERAPEEAREATFTTSEAAPTRVRSAEGIPFPTKPAPDGSKSGS
jgi:D-aminopeptidase